MSNITLQVKDLSKSYKIYNHPRDRVKQAILGSVKKYYRDFWALRDINFEVKKGESIGIIGRNGSGKSTLLQLICKTLTPTTGEIKVHGRIAALLELGAGFNPQFTGRENVYINGAILGFNRHEIDERFDEIAAFADIGAYLDQPVKSYSSGMFVRLAFAVQACVNPDILVIDEALAVGDVFFRQKCYKLLSKLQDKGVSIILVTHAMNEVEQFCQRGILLKQGKILFQGSANEAVKHYYIAEQEARVIQRNPMTETTSVSTPSDFFWPSESAFLDITKINQVTNGWAECTALAVCDNQGHHCHAFQQGDTISVFYEITLRSDIDVPVSGIVIKNDRGINVHGKGTTEYGTQVPETAKQGDILRFRQDICLELAIGEYTFEIGFASMSQADYSQRTHFPYQDFYASMTRLCLLPTASTFAILPRTHAEPVQLLHHGVANLPGNCQMIKLPSKTVENKS